MNPLVVQLIAALITAGPDVLQAVAAIVKAAHGQALTTDEHTALGVALAAAVHPKA